jgi:hypothetical protein
MSAPATYRRGGSAVVAGEMSRPDRPRPPPALRLLCWQDILVLIDHGTASPDQYAAGAWRIAQLAEQYPRGIGILTIIPEDSRPPSEPVRLAIGRALADNEASIRCLVWMVEATGFQGATVRAICNGLRLLRRHPYPTQVMCGLAQSLTWMVSHLCEDPGRLSRVGDAVAAVEHARRTEQFEAIALADSSRVTPADAWRA